MDYFDILLAKKLNGGGGGDIDLQTLTVTENGEQDAPSGVAYNKVITNVPAPSNALFKQTLSNLPQPIATFTGADAPLDSLKASIVGVQSGSGDPSPSNVRPISGWSGANIEDCGKNLVEQYAEWNITGEGEITVASGYTAIIAMVKAGQTYTISRNGTATIPNTMGFYYGKPQVGSVSYNSERIIPNSATFIAPIDGFIVARMSTTSLTEYQIELGSTPTAYADYSGMNVYVSFGQTVYYGALNVSTGELTILYELIDMGDMTWTYQSANTRFVSSDIQTISKFPESNTTPSNIKCSQYGVNSYSAYSDKQIAQSNTGNVFVKDSTYTDATTFKTAMDGVQLVYELATPQTIQLTPTQVRTIQGNNNVFVDCGEVTELKYYSDTP